MRPQVFTRAQYLYYLDNPDEMDYAHEGVVYEYSMGDRFLGQPDDVKRYYYAKAKKELRR